MEASTIIKEIAKLSLIERMLIVENAIKSIREETETKKSMAEAARALLSDYQTDKDLVAFTSLDGESCSR